MKKEDDNPKEEKKKKREREKKRKKNPEEIHDIRWQTVEGHPKLPKLPPIGVDDREARPEAKREEIRTMRLMLDEGYASYRWNGPKMRVSLKKITLIFIAITIVKIVALIFLIFFQSRLFPFITFKNENSSSDFFFRSITYGFHICIILEAWLILVEVVMIWEITRDDPRSLSWLFSISTCISFFVLILASFHVSMSGHSHFLGPSLIGSYLSSTNSPLHAVTQLFHDNDCCGFYSPLDWHDSKLIEWYSEITDSIFTLQQHFAWVDQCGDKKTKTEDKDKNYLCYVPTFCTKLAKEYPKVEVPSYSREDLRLLIQEEGKIPSFFYNQSMISKLNETDGCVPKITQFFDKHESIIGLATAFIVIFLPAQVFLVSMILVNITGKGRLIREGGNPTIEPIDNCAPLSFFKRLDRGTAQRGQYSDD